MSKRKDKTPQREIEPVGAAGPVGQGQVGTPLHKPSHVRDRERVGAGGPVGDMVIEDHDRPPAEHTLNERRGTPARPLS